ncbi:MAG: hypothetical protein DRN25_02645 [Thermoplasmata archaeon]|nr:MAG: hypothetical protein DRN25_02645 [Thermoplasmata archaeon]
MDIWFFIYSFVAIFIIVDPIMNIPFFVSVLERTDIEEYRLIVRKAIVVAAVILILFTYFGNLIFKLLGIKMYSFQIAGGILLFIISLEMLFGRRTRTKVDEREEKEWREDIAITPLAVPLLTGPGAITTGIVLYSNAKAVEQKILLILAIILVFSIAYVILVNSKRIFEIIGASGNRVISRIMGILLAAISIQLIVDGIMDVIKVAKGI